jgi:hypothetical protein
MAMALAVLSVAIVVLSMYGALLPHRLLELVRILRPDGWAFGVRSRSGCCSPHCSGSSFPHSYVIQSACSTALLGSYCASDCWAGSSEAVARVFGFLATVGDSSPLSSWGRDGWVCVMVDICAVTPD